MTPPRSSVPALAYTWTDMFLEQPGLGHMKEIARHLMREAACCGRTALLPILTSNSVHFPGPRRVLRWEDYYDWSPYAVADPRVKSRNDLGRLLKNYPSIRILSANDNPVLAGDDAATLVIRHFPDSNVFPHFGKLSESDQLTDFTEPGFSERFPLPIRKLAEEVASEFSPLSGVLHIRRGDLAGASTSVDAVCRHLASCGVQTSERVFIMTNETDPNYLRALRQEFPGIVFENESIVLQRIHASSGNDNYLAFRVGKCLQAKHDLKQLGTMRFVAEFQAAPRRFRLLDRLSKRLNGMSRVVTPAWLQLAATKK